MHESIKLHEIYGQSPIDLAPYYRPCTKTNLTSSLGPVVRIRPDEVGLIYMLSFFSEPGRRQ